MDRRKEGEGVSLIARTASNSGDVVHSDNERQRVSLHCSLLGLEARGQLWPWKSVLKNNNRWRHGSSV